MSIWNQHITIRLLKRFYTITIQFFSKWLHSDSIYAALQDSNIDFFLPLHKVSLLKSYAELVSTLNLALDIERGFLESTGYNADSRAKEIRGFVREKATRTLKVSKILQREFEDYSKKDSYDLNRIRNINKEIEGDTNDVCTPSESQATK
jgi:hypothetical protein